MKGRRYIRNLKKEDWELYEILDKATFPENRWDKETFMHRMEQDGHFGLFIEDDLEGTLSLARFGEDEAHLARIAVAPMYQGKGYGNMLMDYSIDWFKEQGGIKRVHLYTQEDNYTAQGLYKKYGFVVTGTTWHHIIPRNTIIPTGEYTCQEIEPSEIEEVGDKYAALPAAQIRRFLERDNQHVMTLKKNNGDIIGAARFAPKFPGCFPFILDIPIAFDDFLSGLEPFSLPEFDHIRITYTDMPEVAKICDERGYNLHQKLFKFTLVI